MKVRDVVCGMTIDSETATATTVFRGRTYYFCSDGCREKFEADPKRFIPASEGSEGSEGIGGPHHRHL